MGNEELYTNEENADVSQLLAGLKRVEAPANFDFGVKARIAAGKPSEGRRFRIPVFAGYAAPLVLLLGAGGYLGLSYIYPAREAEVSKVAVSPSTAAPKIDVPTTEVPLTQTPPAQAAAGKKPETITSPNALNVKKTVDARKDSSVGGSFDETQSVGKKIYRNVEIPAKDVLNLLGAKGSFGEKGWTVDAPAANSLAERSGVLAGDVIEEINDQPVTDKSTVKSRSGLKSVRVRRDGKPIDIVLKN